MDESKNLACFFLGLGVGVAVGIVFAPKAGTETRGLLRERAGESGEYLKRRGDQLRSSAGGFVDRGREFVSKQRQQFGASVDAGRQAYYESLGTPDAGPTGQDIRESEGI